MNRAVAFALGTKTLLPRNLPALLSVGWDGALTVTIRAEADNQLKALLR